MQHSGIYLRQSGVSLAIALVILLVVTLLSVASVSTVILQTKMYSNFVDKEYSFQGAESGIREAEKWLANLSAKPNVVSGCGTQVCVVTLRNNFYYETQSDSWWNANAAAFSSGSLAKLANPPRYLIEFIQFTPDTVNIGHSNSSGLYLYRITARSAGNTTNAYSVIQTTFSRRF